MSLYSSVAAGLAELEPLDTRDRAVADLALKYAAAIDDPEAWADKQRDPLAELGAKLLTALTALQMTPAARASAMKAAPGPSASPLDELRRKRAERSGA